MVVTSVMVHVKAEYIDGFYQRNNLKTMKIP
jgi:hypothetical protein